MPYYRKNEKLIRVYNTHITISPYKLGENTRIEHMLSIWVDAEYRYEPIGYYWDSETYVLYVPRGINLSILQVEFNSDPVIVRNTDEPLKFSGVKMMTPPRDRIQVKSINFLSAKEDFTNALKYGQQALILDTGDGKTFVTVASICNYKMCSCIITHQESIKKQWIDTFCSKTNIDQTMLIDVNGSQQMFDIIEKPDHRGYVYFINHQTIQSFARAYGWPMVTEFFKEAHIGIKVFDEAHKNFKNVMHIDFFSNTYKTFYLTANFGRTDTKEARLYKKAFSNVLKFGEETKNYEEKRKHIIYIPVLYRSNPGMKDIIGSMNSYGFSVLNFSKYALYDDPAHTQLHMFDYVFDIANKLEGKILITVPRIDDTNYMVDYIKKHNPRLDKTIATINSRNTKEENNYVKENIDIICSTIKSCGTGVDIKGLRCIINLEPFSSHITANQLAGRLREYAPDLDTYFFDLIDIAFQSCENQYKAKLSHLRKKCKEVKVMRR